MFNKKLLALATGAALLAGAQNGFAGNVTATANYEIELTNGTCTVAATGMVFADKAVGSASLTGEPAGSVTVNCTAGVTYDWGMGQGAHWGVTTTDYRSMDNGAGGNFAYDLFSNGSRIGDIGLTAKDPGYVVTTTTKSYATSTGTLLTGTGAAQTYAVTADLGFVSAPVGVYTDAVTVTVVF